MLNLLQVKNANEREKMSARKRIEAAKKKARESPPKSWIEAPN
jgi:hypothetical protein